MDAVAGSDGIGVLDLQGGVQEHLDHLRRVGVAARPIKRAADLAGLAGLIIPGGESTCLSRLLNIFGLDTAIRQAHGKGLKLWGTCAGAILLARENVGETPFLGLIDVAVNRNAFGSQLDSFNREALAPTVAREPIPLTFIRAPKIVRAGEEVRVLLRLDDYIAAAEDDRILVTVFHPELTPSLAFHRYFARKCGLNVAGDDAGLDPDWTPLSWTRFSLHV
ncbi:MAG: pyridoxal 5'-phosphate synthase glutaminase subunit PdxT [Candidatus Contendobacter sp.]|nr:pyridoxal 5'-phosphate synthase glutaminase subunit PdxT [Candidatus Contendobacter sp.]MDG4556765.1 pyridoxal 5'-phosphate synthase glutaminase subunit PdxT [Candidatus Contendobacter sp.]